MGNMRRTLRNVAIAAALPTLANAVALSDMTPRASDLPDACLNLYTAQIAGCTANDWMTTECSTSCQKSLLALVGPMNAACGGQGIQGQNLVVAFLAGMGPQQLCHNIPKNGETTAAAPTTSTQKTTPTPSIISDSTSTAKSLTETKSLVADTTSSSSEPATTKASTTRKTTAKHTTADTQSSSMAYSSSEAAATTTRANRPTSSPSRTTSSEGSSQTDFDDQSGGGSPFDSPGNLINAASGLSVSALSLALPAIAAILLTTLR